jgi:NTE family protein
MVNSGILPMLQLSPSSPFVRSAIALATFGSRPAFADFPSLLKQRVDFEEIAAWGPRAQRPVLIIGAANVSTGKLVKFVSSKEAIRLEHILASCCVPNIFPAVQIGGELYWDGLFSDNPPVEALMRPIFVGPENVPEEIWVIKINPTASRSSLQQTAHILDRRNQVEGNISLFQQLDHIEMLNDMLLDNAFRSDYLARFHVRAPIRIPKSFDDDPNKPYHIPYIEMPPEVQERLDYEGKIDRSSQNIDGLIALGEASAETFFALREAAILAHPNLVPN